MDDAANVTRMSGRMRPWEKPGQRSGWDGPALMEMETEVTIRVFLGAAGFP